jgi:hypothetical protein
MIDARRCFETHLFTDAVFENDVAQTPAMLWVEKKVLLANTCKSQQGCPLRKRLY